MVRKLTATSVIILLAVFAFAGNAHANVFASDVRVTNPDGSAFDGNLQDDTPGVGIEFRLNENATSVVVTVSDAGGAVVAVVNAGPHPQGLNTVVWAGVDDGGRPVPAGDYTFTVTAADAVGHAGYDVIYAMSGTSIFTRGGTTIRNPAAANFGHPIGGNGGGAGLKRGPLNFFADGTGFEFTEPGLSRYSPWHAPDVTGNPSAGRLYMLTSDDDGWLYYSDRLDPLSKLYRFAPDLDPASLTVVATSDDSSKKGLGLDVVGTGANKTIYWGLANTIVRMAIGEADVFDIANAELVAAFDPVGGTANVLIRDIVIDDSGFLYASLRTGAEPAGTNPGLAVEKYDISGTLPVNRGNSLWSIPVGTDNNDGRPVGFGFERGDDLTSNVDDVIYFSSGSGTADGNWNTIRKIDDLSTGGSTVVFVDISGSGTTSDNADMAVDAAGNLIWFENSSEWLIAVSPPDGPNSFTTPANDVISISTASSANAHPSISSVDDVPNDQGYQVRVSWAGSVLDRAGNAGIASYEVYRQVEGSGAANSKSQSNQIAGPPGDWELVGSTSARQTSNYNLVVPTIYNQTADTTINTTFYVSAVNREGTRWDSPAAEGFSVDNLVPTAPTNLTATEVEPSEGVFNVLLQWDESPDEDFNYFAVYRSTQSGFDPTAMPPSATLVENEYVDANANVGETYYYRVAAIDFNGNLGEFSDEVSLVVTSVKDRPTSGLPTEFTLQQNYPNPFNPTTQISYDIAKTSAVSIKIYNMSGQLVRTLVDGEQPQGRYTITWDATSDDGVRAPSGVYLYVLRTESFVKSHKMTLLK